MDALLPILFCSSHHAQESGTWALWGNSLGVEGFGAEFGSSLVESCQRHGVSLYQVHHLTASNPATRTLHFLQAEVISRPVLGPGPEHSSRSISLPCGSLPPMNLGA
jgi:hypothetical protein